MVTRAYVVVALRFDGPDKLWQIVAMPRETKLAVSPFRSPGHAPPVKVTGL